MRQRKRLIQYNRVYRVRHRFFTTFHGVTRNTVRTVLDFEFEERFGVRRARATNVCVGRRRYTLRVQRTATGLSAKLCNSDGSF